MICVLHASCVYIVAQMELLGKKNAKAAARANRAAAERLLGEGSGFSKRISADK